MLGVTQLKTSKNVGELLTWRWMLMSELMSGPFHIVSVEKTPVGLMHFLQNGRGKKKRKLFDELGLKCTFLLPLNLKGVLK